MDKTHREILREGGKILLRNMNVIYSNKAFRRVFRVGSLISFGSGLRVARISAIGKKRFLMVVTRGKGEPYENYSEYVGTIESPRGWRKP